MGSPMLVVVGRNLLLERGSGAKTRGNLECRGHAGATMMLAFETLLRILSSAKTFP